jgi:hypothetical protein
MSYIKNLVKISNHINTLSQSTNLIIVTKNQDQNIIKKLAETNHINFSGLWTKERGSINHYTIEGNSKIFETLEDIISE